MSLVYEWEYAPSSLVVYKQDLWWVYNREVFGLHQGLHTVVCLHHLGLDWCFLVMLEHSLSMLYHSLVKLGHCPHCQIHIQNHYQESLGFCGWMAWGCLESRLSWRLGPCFCQKEQLTGDFHCHHLSSLQLHMDHTTWDPFSAISVLYSTVNSSSQFFHQLQMHFCSVWHCITLPGSFVLFWCWLLQHQGPVPWYCTSSQSPLQLEDPCLPHPLRVLHHLQAPMEWHILSHTLSCWGMILVEACFLVL